MDRFIANHNERVSIIKSTFKIQYGQIYRSESESEFVLNLYLKYNMDRFIGI